MRNSVMEISIAESIFDDAKIRDLIEMYQESQGIYGNGGGVH